MNQFYVYVIVSEVDGRFYYGQTNSLQNRLSHHNNGYSSYTKPFRPWNLFAFLEVGSRAEAMAVEKKLKNIKSRAQVKAFLEKNLFQLVIGPEKS